MKNKKNDIEDEILSKRLMAYCAGQEIRDYINGKGEKKLAEKSLQLLLEMLDEAIPKNKLPKTKNIMICDWNEKVPCNDQRIVYECKLSTHCQHKKKK
jgi:hypothetical protein